MIVKIGNIFESKAKTLVNTINCVGIMGKGIALEFKVRYPQMFENYLELCKQGKVKPGIPYFYNDLYGNSILNFPTKDHWRSPSKLSYIVDGLNWFRSHYKEYNIESIAFPPLGCGNGGLKWDLVGPIMYTMLKDLPLNIEIYAPFGTSPDKINKNFLDRNIESYDKDIVGTQLSKFNKYWLLIPYVVKMLNNDKYALPVGRTIFQKVCYILTRVGIPTGFNFVEGYYGPYSKEVGEAIIALSNANYMTEHKLGKMVETVISPSFKLPYDEFNKDDLDKADYAFDLLSRIKSTAQAEMIATILFSYDKINEKFQPTEKEIYEYVINWKPRWNEKRRFEIISTINELSALGWMKPRQDTGLLIFNEDLF